MKHIRRNEQKYTCYTWFISNHEETERAAGPDNEKNKQCPQKPMAIYLGNCEGECSMSFDPSSLSS